MNRLLVKEQLKTFFCEDIGHGDVTAEAMFDAETGIALFRAKEAGIFCGEIILQTAYELFHPTIEVKIHKKDGEELRTGDVLAEIQGPIVDLLSSERVILNLIQRLSGIATQTHTAVQEVTGSSARICDTRKTTPGLRMLEKYAVKCGGGFNHRFGLNDAVLIKDNHIAQCGGSISLAIQKVRSNIGHMVKVEVEVESRDQVLEAIVEEVDVIMFDNCSPVEAAEWRKLVPPSIIVEVSGGIRHELLRAYAESGVDYISMGALTHSVKALDISLDVSVKEGVTHA
jgi:nicotinate-nucleotide pyrophosphorylase (carboxylating)